MRTEDIRLLERTGEIQRIGALLDGAADGRGSVLMIDGEAGIGKSTLIAAARDEATARGFTVLCARGGEHEQSHGFGAVRQLFGAVVANGASTSVFSGAAHLAHRVLDVSDVNEGADEGAGFAVQHGLHWLTANLANDGPLLVTVDDAQWIDTASARWLHYLVRRIDDLALALIVATRTGEASAVSDELRAMHVEPASDDMNPAALTIDATIHLLRAEMPAWEADASFAEACHRATGGNPLLLRELVRALVQEAIDPTTASIDLIEKIGSRRIGSYVLLRLSRLGADAVRVARAASVLGSGLEFRRVRQLSGLDGGDADDAVNALVTGGILTDTDPLDFVHPVVRAAVYDDLPATERTRLHLAAAHVLADEGARDEAAVQLLSAERIGDPWVVTMLVDAGRRARNRGAGAEAVQLLARALAEPPSESDRPRVLIELGRTERIIGDAAAADHLQEALRTAVRPEETEHAVNELAYALGVAGDISGGADVLEKVIEDLSDDDQGALRLEATLLSLLLNHEDFIARGAARLEALLASTPPDMPGRRTLLALETWTRFEAGKGTAAELGDIATKAFEGRSLVAELGPDALPVQAGIAGLQRCERFDLATPLVNDVLTASRRKGSVFGVAAALVLRSHGSWIVGDLRSLEKDASEAIEMSLAAESPYFFAAGLAMHAAGLVEQGRASEAEQLLATWGLDVLDPPTYVMGRFILYIRARLHYTQGRYELAVTDALAALDRDRRRFGEKPLAYWGLHEAALALHFQGDNDGATALAQEYVERARAWQSPGETAMALHVMAIVDPASAPELLPEAIDLLRRSARRLELARVLVDHGTVLRHAGRVTDARPALREGMEIAHTCGAKPLTDRARVELSATGERVRRLAVTGAEALTASELRIAELAAGHLSNPEIAQMLFLSRKTVEAHLRSVFRKLNITSRKEIGSALRSAEPISS